MNPINIVIGLVIILALVLAGRRVFSNFLVILVFIFY